ncbi:dTMP kinase [Nannocystaceae bacterium ST9]
MSTAPASPPRFLVLEGIDGSGTTTQSQRLAERLRARGHRVLETREPSRGPIGAMTREMLAADSSRTVGPEALALLFAADRLEHLAREIEPALAEGQLVICDRYLVSSWVYQSLDCDPSWVRALNRHARWPDLTFVFALSAELALARVAARRAASGEPIERFDQAPTQRRLAEGYARVLAEADPREAPGLVHVDAAAEIAVVTETLVERCIAAGL